MAFSVSNIAANDAVAKIAVELEKNENVKIPAWYGTVKSSAHAERVPDSPKLWFSRVASVFRTLILRGSVGVRRLRTKYGGRDEHTVGRAHHKKSGGKAIRLALQQLEKAGLVKKEKEGGRIATDVGLAFVEKACK